LEYPKVTYVGKDDPEDVGESGIEGDARPTVFRADGTLKIFLIQVLIINHPYQK